MPTGTIAKLAIALGVETSGVVTGMALAKKQVSTGLAEMQAEADASGRRGASTLAGLSRNVIGVVGAAAIGIGGLVDLAVKFESESAKVAASAGITNEAARSIAQGILDASGTTIYAANEITDSYAKVAGQMGLTEGRALNEAEAVQFMANAQNLAGASNESLEASTASLSEVMQAYHENLSQTASTTDILYDASKNLNEPLDGIATVVDRLHGALGPLAPDLRTTTVLLEEMATQGFDISRTQRFLNQFVTEIQHLTNTTPDVKALAAAQKELATAQEQLQKLEGRAPGGVRLPSASPNAGIASALNTEAYANSLSSLSLKQTEYNSTLEKYGLLSDHTAKAAQSVDNAQLSADRSKARITEAANSAAASQDKALAAHAKAAAAYSSELAAAQDKVAAAQLKVNDATGAAAGYIKSLGLHIYDATGNFVGMRSIIEQLNPVFEKLNTNQRIQVATTLFGPKADNMINLILAGTAAWDKYSNSLGRAGGASEGYQRATDNLASRWKVITAETQKIAQELALRLEEPVKNLEGFAMSVLPSLGNALFTAFTIGEHVVGDFWSVLHPMLSYLLDHDQIILGFLAFFAARWVTIKALNIGGEILGWAGGLRAFALEAADSGKYGAFFSTLRGATGFGGVQNAIDDSKKGWHSLFDARSIYSTSGMASDFSKAIKDSQAFETELRNLAVLPPEVLSGISSHLAANPEQMSKVFAEMKLPQLASRAAASPSDLSGRLDTMASTAVLDAAFGSARLQSEQLFSARQAYEGSGIAKDLAMAVKDAQAYESELNRLKGLPSNIFDDVAASLRENPEELSKVFSQLKMPQMSIAAKFDTVNLADQFDIIAKDAAIKLARETANGIKKGAADAAPTVAKDVADAASKAATSGDASLFSKVVGKVAPVLGKVSGIFAQPVQVMNTAPILVAMVGSASGLLHSGKNAAADAQSVEQGVTNALAKDAKGTASSASVSEKIVKGVADVAKGSAPTAAGLGAMKAAGSLDTAALLDTVGGGLADTAATVGEVSGSIAAIANPIGGAVTAAIATGLALWGVVHTVQGIDSNFKPAQTDSSNTDAVIKEVNKKFVSFQNVVGNFSTIFDNASIAQKQTLDTSNELLTIGNIPLSRRNQYLSELAIAVQNGYIDNQASLDLFNTDWKDSSKTVGDILADLKTFKTQQNTDLSATLSDSAALKTQFDDLPKNAKQLNDDFNSIMNVVEPAIKNLLSGPPVPNISNLPTVSPDFIVNLQGLSKTLSKLPTDAQSLVNLFAGLPADASDAPGLTRDSVAHIQGLEQAYASLPKDGKAFADIISQLPQLLSGVPGHVSTFADVLNAFGRSGPNTPIGDIQSTIASLGSIADVTSRVGIDFGSLKSFLDKLIGKVTGIPIPAAAAVGSGINGPVHFGNFGLNSGSGQVGGGGGLVPSSPGDTWNIFTNPGRAAGGPVLPNKSYIVGEEGWELFVPDTSGFIVPHQRSVAITAMMGQRMMEAGVPAFAGGSTPMIPAFSTTAVHPSSESHDPWKGRPNQHIEQTFYEADVTPEDIDRGLTWLFKYGPS